MNYSKRIKTIIKLMLVFVSIAIALFFSKEFISNYYVRFNLNNIEAPNANSRVIIFSPHNDDEVLGSAELIKKTIKNGGQVKVVLITNGDGFRNAIQFDYFNVNPKPKDFIKFGYTRQKESIAALKKLGLSEDNIIFLGYPDGGISHMWNSNWDSTDPYLSTYTQTNKTPYKNSFTEGAVYTGENLVSDIAKIIEEYKPNYVVMPHPNDRHPDHWSTNAFVKYSLKKLDYKPDKELLYLVHRGDWPTPMKKNVKMYLVPPYKLMNIGTDWHALDLTNSDITEKASVIHGYKTQIRTLGLLMSAFERKNELFGEYNDIKLISHKRDDNNIKPDNSNKVIIDPLQDALTLEISKNADISAVYVEESKSNNLHVFLEMDDEVESETTYNFNLIFFNGNNISRLNVEKVGERLIPKYISTQSIMDAKGIVFETKGKVIHLIIPSTLSGNYNSIFINAATFVEDRRIDKTAWRMVNR